MLRQYALCEELSRAGELFVTLHMNPAGGMSSVRPLPASSIDKVITAPGDYETELEYHEAVGYFAWALVTIALTAYNRVVRLGKRPGEVCSQACIRIGVPDISLAALASVAGQGIGGPAWRRLVVRTVLEYAGEEQGLSHILAEAEART